MVDCSGKLRAKSISGSECRGVVCCACKRAFALGVKDWRGVVWCMSCWLFRSEKSQ